jgi:hypothetical protein
MHLQLVTIQEPLEMCMMQEEINRRQTTSLNDRRESSIIATLPGFVAH